MTPSTIDQPPILPVAALTELKALLGITNAEDDALLFAHLRAAYGLCEAFIGQALLHSRRRWRMALRTGAQRLPDSPVAAIHDVRINEQTGTGPALPITGYRIDIDAQGHGAVALLAPLPSQPVTAYYVVGIASDWNDLAEPLRQGIIRLAAHQHLHGTARSSSGGDAAPPMLVAALWRPWRRMRLA